MGKKQLSAKQKAAKAKKEKERRDAKKKAAAEAANGDLPADPPVEDDKPKKASRSKRDLVTLDAWNAERKPRWIHPSPDDDTPNGIACPHCGEETLDRSPGRMVPGVPPRMEIHCNAECGFVGRRIA